MRKRKIEIEAREREKDGSRAFGIPRKKEYVVHVLFLFAKKRTSYGRLAHVSTKGRSISYLLYVTCPECVMLCNEKLHLHYYLQRHVSKYYVHKSRLVLLCSVSSFCKPYKGAYI